jgi:hypothetical protein
MYFWSMATSKYGHLHIIKQPLQNESLFVFLFNSHLNLQACAYLYAIITYKCRPECISLAAKKVINIT